MKDKKHRGLLFAVCILGLILSGCRAAPPGSGGTATQPLPPPAAVPVTGNTPSSGTPPASGQGAGGWTAGDPHQAILNAMRAQLDTKGVRVYSTVTTGSETVQNLVEFVPPESYHMIVNNNQTEIILVDGKTYTRTGGTWTVAPMSLGSLTSQLMGEQLIQEVDKTISDIQVVGPDVIDGAPVMVYQYQQTMKAGDASLVRSASKLYVRVADGLPVKLESDIDSGTTRSTLTNRYEYDPTIRITAPEISKPSQIPVSPSRSRRSKVT